MSRLLYRLSYAALRRPLYLKIRAGAIENTLFSLAGSGKPVALIALAKSKKAQNSLLTICIYISRILSSSTIPESDCVMREASIGVPLIAGTIVENLPATQMSFQRPGLVKSYR